jgi:PAS domain S-box-containing protein
VYVNHAFELLTGWTAAEVIDKNPRILQGPLTDRKVTARLRQCLIDGTNFHGEAINYRKNGVPFWMEWKISPVKDASGKITNFIAFQRDISQAKAAQQRIEDFHSVLSHELRAPLTSILGSLRLIEEFDNPHSAEGKEFLEIAISSTVRLSSLINDLLELSKIESGQIELKLVDVSVTELVDTAAKALINYRSDDQVIIDIASIDAQVRVDRDRIVQVLINLISNAMKFSPANAAVLVSVTQEGGAIRFSVSDKGPGISEENQLKLFTKFIQLVSADGIQRQGTGLGLSTVKALVEQHSGRLGVSSRVGQGSTFWFELDAVGAAVAVSPPLTKALLLVEDDKSLAKLIKFHLISEGYALHSVSTLQEAIAVLETTKLDACIIDMVLPDGMGVNLVEKIDKSSLNAKVPILMTSASRFNDSELGSPVTVSWLYKPFELGELAAQIKQMLSGICQRLVIFENAESHWEVLPSLIDDEEFATIDCAQDSCIDAIADIGPNRNVIVKFDGSDKAEKNILRLAKGLTRSKAIIICSKEKFSHKTSQALNGLIGELVSAEKLSESEFVSRLRSILIVTDATK